MARPALFLHIGAPKTGTTYLQSLMRQQRKQLRKAGLLVPGPKGNQKAAARDFVRHGASPRSKAGPWADLVAEVREFDGPAVVSNETFGARLGPGHLDRLARDFADREMQVVFTVRDLQRQLPAAWQEAVKNGSTLGFHDYVDLVATSATGEDFVKERRLWRAQDARHILGPWSQFLGPEAISVVTVPPRGSPGDLLWRRFAAVLTVDPTCVDPTAVRPNASLGSVETNVLRRINTALDERDGGIGEGDYIRLVKTPLANGVLQYSGARSRIALTAEQSAWAAAESARVADDLSQLGYRVVGDLDDMRPSPAPQDTDYVDPDLSQPEAERDAAIATLVALILRGASQRAAG